MIYGFFDLLHVVEQLSFGKDYNQITKHLSFFFLYFPTKGKNLILTQPFQISNESKKHMKGVQLTRKLY